MPRKRVANPTRNQLWARVRQAAHAELAEIHPQDYRRLLHAQKHAQGMQHLHSPEEPETIHTWGEVYSQPSDRIVRVPAPAHGEPPTCSCPTEAEPCPMTGN